MRRLATLLVVLLAFPAAAAAQCPKTTLGDVEDEVMCPVCGTPLGLATEAPQAIRQRAFIQRLAEDCRSKEQIKTALAAEFGEDVLALPEDDGFSLAAYLVPILALLAGVVAIVLSVARWRRRPKAEGVPNPSQDERLDEDMQRYEL